jgi:hypothetical protein
MLKASTFSRKQLLIFALAFGLIGGYIIYHSFAAPNPNLPGDLNADNVVNVSDLSILLTAYGTTNSAADINTDGNVNVIDLSILLTHYGQNYVPPTPPPPPPPPTSFVPGACGTGGCTPSTVHGFNIIVPDSTPPSQGGNATGEPTSCTVVGPGCVTRNFQIYRPNNLLTNPKPPLMIAYSGSVANNPQWYADASQRGYVIALIFNVHNNGGTTNNMQYAFPTPASNPPNAFVNCGINGASQCDDIPQVSAVLSDLNCPYVSGGSTSICQGYNTNEVFVEGGSKGGLATMATVCDTRTSTKIAGSSAISDLLISTGGNVSVPPNCPAMFAPTSSCVSNCLSVTPNKNIAMQWLWGSSDPGGGNTTCTVTAANDCFGNGYLDSNGRWHIGLIQSASDVFGHRVLGCSSTPASSTTTGKTGKITTKTYRGCTNPNLATQTVDVFGGLHMPDTWPCNSLNGSVCGSGTDFASADGLSEPAAAWAFWTTYFP